MTTDADPAREAGYQRGIDELERRGVPFPSPPVEFVRIIGQQARQIAALQTRLRDDLIHAREQRRETGEPYWNGYIDAAEDVLHTLTTADHRGDGAPGEGE